MGKTVVGVYDDFDDAQRVVNDLEAAGFPRNDISIVANNSSSRFGSHEGQQSGGHHTSGGSIVKGALGGATEGAVIGGLTGLAAGLAALLIPGLGAVAAVGPLSAALSGAGLGALGGGAIGILANLGIPKEEAHVYAESVRRGGTMVTITTSDDRADEAMRIFDRYNPVDIDTRSAYYRQSGFTGFDDKAPAYTHEQIHQDRQAYSTFATSSNPGVTAAAPAATTAATNLSTSTGTTGNTVRTGEEVHVPIVEEQLSVGKREVQRGRARIHTYVQETPVQEQVTLREEHVNVERHPVNRAVSGTDLTDAFQERTIEVTERAEVPVVAKEARVVEEVVVNKEATQHTETVRDTVRRTEVDVDEDVDTDVTSTTTTTGTTGNIRR